MFRRLKVRKAPRPAKPTRTTWLPRKKLVFEMLEDRIVFDSASIIAENALPGTPQSVWDLNGTASDNIEGFAAQFSIDHGQTEQFKVNTDASAWHIDIYRMGYYGGDGARLITTITSHQAQNQPDPITDLNTGLVDAGNWSVSASWNIPATAVSGVYVGKLVRDDGTFGESQIIFVVRADDDPSAIVFKTSDSTWEAYNDWGGSSLYGTDLGPDGRSYEVSYNRPFTTRDRIAANFYFGEELAQTEFMEQNGYDVTYIASVDLDRDPSILLDHKVFMSVGHDEYYSAAERDAVVAAGAAGVNLAFFSGNEMFWKTYLEPSTDATADPYTTIVCYKETFDNALTDPQNPDVWTGTWRDPRFSSQTDGGQPENAVTGQLFMSNGDGTIGYAMTVPASDANLRFWANTSVAKLTGNQTATLGQYLIGYEFDVDADNGYRPAGQFDISSSTLNVGAVLQDYGTTYAPGTLTHSMSMYRLPSGALVFGAGTIQYSWGLSDAHDGPSSPVVKDLQQATVNLFADMGAQPGSLMKGLVAATMSTDHTAPTSTITSLANNAVLKPNVAVTIKGTAQDSGGGVVAGVEISLDGGATWHPVTGTTSWSYTYTPHSTGQFQIMTRATDDSGNTEVPTTKLTINPNTNPGIYSLFTPSMSPGTADSGDGQSVTVGLQFRTDVDGFITGLSFYKSSANTGTHIASLWDSNGVVLATATFVNETASGWQQVTFASPVQVQAGMIYTAGYYAPNGHYAADRNYFAPVGVDNGPLHAIPQGALGTNGVFSYGNNQLPTQSYQSTNYWVDVTFNTVLTLDTTPPTVQNVTAAGGSSSITTDSSFVITFSEALNPSSITSSTVELINTASTNLPAGCCGVPSGWCSGCPLSMGAQTTVIKAYLSYDPSTDSVTIVPSAPLSTSSIYSVYVKGGAGGVTDTAGNPVANDTMRSFITPALPNSIVSTAFPATTVPKTLDSGDSQGVELGMQFVASTNGTISGVRFYKSAANTGVHTGSLWSSTGQLLATGTFSNETASGWQQLNFATPVAVTAGQTYVASYHTTSGHYSVTTSAFKSATTSGFLTIPANGGVYLYGSGGFPKSTANSSNYFVDVVLHTAPPTDNIAPTVTGYTPAANTTDVSTSSLATVTFSEAIDPSTITSTTVKLLDGSNMAVPATLTYDTALHTVTITPTAPLSNSMSYTIFVMGGIAGVKDAAGNPVASSVGSKFTTVAAPGPDVTPPTVLAYNPTSGATNVPTTGPFTITFSEALNSASVTTTNVILLKNGVNRVPETVTYDAATHSVTITPNSPLLGSTNYTIYLLGGSNGLEDLAGNSLATTTSTFVTAAPDTTPPTVTSVSPTNNGTNVATTSPVTVTFSEAVNPSTVSTATISLITGSNVSIPGAVTYNAATNTATFTPTNPLANGATYTVVVNGGAGGVTDMAGNALAATVTSSFTTVVSLPSGGGNQTLPPSSLWATTTTPTTVDSADKQAVEVGVKFTASANGTISGVRFYKATANTGTHTGSLWSSTGQLLATGTFTSETASGWQTLVFAQPIAITAGTTYVASYHTTVGHYSANRSYFTSSYSANGITVAASGGVYAYGNSSFPTQSYQSTNYWVDVLYNATPADTTPPSITGITPANGVANVAANPTVTVSFSEALNAATVTATSVSLRDANNNAVAATVTYNSSTNTVTLTPSSALTGGAEYTVVVLGGSTGVKDVAGNALSSTTTSSFVTATPDTTPPTVTGIMPASGATNVATSASLSVTFSEALNAATVTSSTITLVSNNTVIPATVSYNSATNTATITPTSALSNSTSYTIMVVGGSSGVKDLAGNALAANATSNFTVVADTTPPAVTAISPSSGATNVAVGSPVTVTFSEAMNAATITSSTILLKNASNVTVAATLSYNAATKTATLTPTSALANSTGYTITVVSGSSGVKDLAGNALASNVTSTFTTVAADTTPPTVTGITPASGATNVAINAAMTISFSEALNSATVNSSTITLKNSSNVVIAATVSYNAANNTVTVTPSIALANGTGYTLTVTTGVQDLAGNAMAANVSSTFTTVAAAPVVSSLWPSTTTPATVDSGDKQAVEVGVKFSANTSGYVTGIEFYKAAANTGTHTGSLWSSTGQLLATGTFTNETASGWQTLVFSTPVAITAGTTYVASYHTTAGHYSASRSYFASSFTSGALTVPANGGVYAYGTGGFPKTSYQSTNYWVDVLFSTTPPVDNTPPTVTAVTPAGASTNVSTSAAVTVTFSEALNAATITSSTITLRDSNNVLVPATVTYNASTKTATLTPTSPLSNSMTYLVTISGGAGGVTDVAGNALATNIFSSFTTIGKVGASSTLFDATITPSTVDSGDKQAVELGVKFTANANGFITGVQFYKSAANTGTHTGSLWSSTGQLLATGTFVNETASGWQTLVFSTPVAITAGTTYIASYHTASGHYSVNQSYFTKAYTSGALTVPANGGVYLYGNSGFPSQTYLSSNYWVEPVFAAIGS